VEQEARCSPRFTVNREVAPLGMHSHSWRPAGSCARSASFSDHSGASSTPIFRPISPPGGPFALPWARRWRKAIESLAGPEGIAVPWLRVGASATSSIDTDLDEGRVLKGLAKTRDRESLAGSFRGASCKGRLARFQLELAGVGDWGCARKTDSTTFPGYRYGKAALWFVGMAFANGCELLHGPHRESFDLDGGISHSVPIAFGTRVAKTVFSSGIMGVDPASPAKLGRGIAAQVRFGLQNMGGSLCDKRGIPSEDVGYIRVLVPREFISLRQSNEECACLPGRNASRPGTTPGRSNRVRGGMLVSGDGGGVLR